MDNVSTQKQSDIVGGQAYPSDDIGPFYIISPPYSETSTHSRALFSLCHYLNTIGENAFIFPYPVELKNDQRWPYFCRLPVGTWFNSRLNVKILTQEISDDHFNRGLTPICIVPEIFDDPICAPYIVRYIIDFSGKLEMKYSTPQQFTFCYSKKLVEYTGGTDTLYIPDIDMNYFFDKKNDDRKGLAYYVNGPLDQSDEEFSKKIQTDVIVTKITLKTTKEERRKTFWKVKHFYCFQDSEFAIEAVLCGCNVIYLLDKRFEHGPILSSELGLDWFTWYNEQEDNDKLSAARYNLRLNLLNYFNKIPEDLGKLVSKVKADVETFSYNTKIELPYSIKHVFIDSEKTNQKSWQSVPFRIRDKKLPNSATKRGLYFRLRNAIRIFLIDWVIPPKVSKAIIKIRNVFLRRR